MSATRASDAAHVVILCYDGSTEAQQAIAFAGELLPKWRAVVVSAWKEVIEEALSTGLTRPVTDLADANKRKREAAELFAEQGARLAEQHGLRAQPLVVKADGPVWEAIELIAEERDGELIVCGTGQSGVRASLPGTLPRSLLAHASRPVLVVPSARASAERIRELAEERTSHGRLRARA
jgi:nucleotide-binding universal stress UspA family protein